MLQEKVNDIKEAILADMRKGEEVVFRGLVLEAPVNRIPEKVFVDYFLPGFLGESVNRDWLLEWVTMADSPASEVAVCDNVSGEELFRVPPILATGNVVLPRDGQDLGDIFREYDVRKNSLGGQSANFLFSALNHKSNQALVTDRAAEINSRWGAILARYGAAPAEAPPAGAASTSEDLFEY